MANVEATLALMASQQAEFNASMRERHLESMARLDRIEASQERMQAQQERIEASQERMQAQQEANTQAIAHNAEGISELRLGIREMRDSFREILRELAVQLQQLEQIVRRNVEAISQIAGRGE